VTWLWALWRRQSLRARITIVTTALFAFAVLTGAALLLSLQRVSLIRALDTSAMRAANEVAAGWLKGTRPSTLLPGAGDQMQVVNGRDEVVSASPNTDHTIPLLSPDQLARARAGDKITIAGDPTFTDDRLRVAGVRAGTDTVVVASGLGVIENSERILRTAALVGCPLGVLAMGLATYFIVGRTLRPVAALRRGAVAITAAGLADQRLPVPNAQDEIQRLATTLNAMLDRIDAATKRQRTFVGDAAHELRSPLASLRLQLEVAERVGAVNDWKAVLDDALVDVGRLNRLVEDLLALARSDEGGGTLRRREPVRVDGLVSAVATEYRDSRVPVTVSATPATVDGDPDALRRVALNLLDNAVRYATSGVTVAVHNGRDAAGQPAVELIVADDGPGIAPAERERVFDRFYRIHASRSRESGGTGLGLPIVRDLVRAHGGTVALLDNDPRGLRAIVTLPTATASDLEPLVPG
jgi:signal transduction histidine kinase